MTRYYASRTLMVACIFMAVRASLWAAVSHAAFWVAVLPVVMWMVVALMAWSLCPESPELAEVTE